MLTRLQRFANKQPAKIAKVTSFRLLVLPATVTGHSTQTMAYSTRELRGTQSRGLLAAGQTRKLFSSDSEVDAEAEVAEVAEESFVEAEVEPIEALSDSEMNMAEEEISLEDLVVDKRADGKTASKDKIVNALREKPQFLGKNNSG